MSPKEYTPTTFDKFFDAVYNIMDKPVTWFREKVVVPNRPTYYWYHRKFRRVPTIDECYTDDIVCIQEAREQFRRDKMVEDKIVVILRNRWQDCIMYEYPNHVEKCTDIMKQYVDATDNWFIKYGELGAYGDVITAYMKQKHRLVWERRHGPVGSGMRDEWTK